MKPPHDAAEANELLTETLAPLREMSYGELASVFMNKPQHRSVRGSRSGAEYRLEVEVFWDGKRGGDIRVRAGINPANRRFSRAMTEDFILRPDGSLVDEESR